MQNEKLALILANARRIIKRKASMKNLSLVMELLGCGSTTAYKYCRALGLDPDSNQTCYTTMIAHIRAGSAQAMADKSVRACQA